MSVLLDLFSTSQTKHQKSTKNKRKTDKEIYDSCSNNAPYFAYQIEGKKWGIVQGCCNDWNCPKCGQQRAREEYGRIVAGAREVAKTNQLYLFTITCRGKEMKIEDAESGYLKWTNRLLTRLRTETKRAHREWYYASVTERQTRAHPHSHFITTYCPTDAIQIEKGREKHFAILDVRSIATHTTLQSYSLERACSECGLGSMYDISRLESVEAGSRYAAKYLFKSEIFNTIWPKGWRRVRYSQNWPKLPTITGEAFILLTQFDWYRLSREALIVKTKTSEAATYARHNLRDADTIIQ